MQLLRASQRGAPARQQTLRATLDWSYSLLDPNERVAVRRLSVFAGSFGLEAACTVVVADDLDRWTALDALKGLVEKSLMQVEQRDPPRFRLLESTRLYAGEALGAAGEIDATARRYGAAMAALADAAESDFWTESDAAWLARYAPDYDDLHAAFDQASLKVEYLKKQISEKKATGENRPDGIEVSKLDDEKERLVKARDEATKLRLSLLQSARPLAQPRS